MLTTVFSPIRREFNKTLTLFTNKSQKIGGKNKKPNKALDYML